MYLRTTSSFTNMLTLCCSFWIKASKSCCCIRFDGSNTILYRASNFWLLRLNSTYESTFLIRCYTLLEFCYRLLTCFCASPVCTSRGILILLKLFVAYMSFLCPQMSLLYLRNSFRCFKLLIYLFYTQIVANGSDIFHLFM